jgi:probable rRNA maturation factor
MITIELPSSFDVTLSASGLTRFLNRALTAVGLKGEVDVLLTGDGTLRQLNKNFRGKNKPTDVLSFPAPAEFATTHAGDLAISLETAARQATTYGHTLREEIKILLLHGLLHLSGEDHETDNGEMATREATLRRGLRLSTTLIERAATTSPKPSFPRTRKSSLKKTSSRLPRRSSSRPNAVSSVAAVKSPAHLARATSATRSKRGSK